MAKNRMRLVDSTVKKELGAILSREVFPYFTNCLITVTDVKTAGANRNA